MLKTAGAEFARRAKADGKEAAMHAFVDGIRQYPLILRRLETCGKPAAAAINGVCLGGGFELALACHYRIVADTDKARVGLPEIKVGLFPGAGGTQRVPRLMPTPDALQMLLKGDQIRPAAAKKMGLVHEVAPADQIVALAKAWVRANPNAKAPWDDPKFRLPSGKVFSPQGMMIWPPANAIYRRETYDNYPAAKAVLSSVFEGLQLPMDLALAVESKYFANILLSKEAAAMIRSLFLSMGELNKGARRPANVPATNLRKIGVLGAGLMGGGIAYVSALAGLDVVLIDRDQESADKGKAYSDKVVSSQIAKGRAKTADKDALLARIKATADYAELKGCDLVIEAVFEDRAVKAEATTKAQAVLGPDVVFASNTSTLPITSLAETSLKPECFIGVHFFSPVEKMMLVEIIMGEKTDSKALAAAMDFVRAIKKTPIVVNDCRGFYVNRCVGNYMVEAHAMVMEGVPPAMIENAAKMAGMPVGPLALNDEVGIDLSWKILQAAEKDLGPKRHRSRPERSLSRRWSSRKSASAARTARASTIIRRTDRRAFGRELLRSPASGSTPTRSASRISRTATCSPWRSRPRAAWPRASSPIRARPTSARSSASGLRLIRAARSRSSTAWGSRPLSRARKNSRRNTAPASNPPTNSSRWPSAARRSTEPMARSSKRPKRPLAQAVRNWPPPESSPAGANFAFAAAGALPELSGPCRPVPWRGPRILLGGIGMMIPLGFFSRADALDHNTIVRRRKFMNVLL